MPSRLALDFGVGILDSGSWFLGFGFWSFDFRGECTVFLGLGFRAPTVWLSSASTWGAKSTHTFQRGLRENPKG